MNLVIDIGNTQIKVAVFKKDIIFEKYVFLNHELYNSIKNISKNIKITSGIIASVNKIDTIEIENIKKLFPLLILDYKVKLPFKNKYKTPNTLGVDRIALIAAAVSKYPKQNTLVIDAGSCITYDFVNSTGVYSGGSISPGIAMRYKSLNYYTANLPDLKLTDIIPQNGNSTENAIHLGIIKGVIFEIEGVINEYLTKNKKLTVILTGGDTIFLARNIKSTIFANPNFLLEGLNSILTYNLEE